MKNLFLNIIKALIILNAIFWVFLCAIFTVIYVDNSILHKNLKQVASYLIYGLGPIIIYWTANKLFKFDFKKKEIFVRGKYIHQRNALEISENKIPNWTAFFTCLFIIIATGFICLSYSRDSYWAFYIFFILLPFLPLTIAILIRATDKTPVLVLTDDKIAYKYWKCEYVLFSDVEDVASISLSGKQFLTIKVHDLSKYKSDINMGTDALYVHMEKLNYDRKDLLEIINEKLMSLPTPIRKIVDKKSSKAYTPNKFSTKKLILRGIISISILVYVTYGIISGKLLIPSNNGGMEFYGLSAYLILVAAILFSVYLMSDIMDHYDERNNETFYIKVKKIAIQSSCAILLIAGYTWLYQNLKDSVCRNDIIREAASVDVGMYAYFIKRSCAIHDPANDKNPQFCVSVYSSPVNTAPNIPCNSAVFENCSVKNIYWEGKTLIIEYSITDINKSRWNASLRNNPPVRVKLKRVSTW